MFRDEYECDQNFITKLKQHGFSNKPLIKDIKLDDLEIFKEKLYKASSENPEASFSGLYFWVVNDVKSKKSYQLYLGSANERSANPKTRRGVVGRVFDYTGVFFPSSPNDFKIQFFDKFIKEQNVECSYTIYFSKFMENNLTLRKLETATRRSFNCIFENKAVFRNGFKKEIADAYYKVYKNQHFTAKLKN